MRTTVLAVTVAFATVSAAFALVHRADPPAGVPAPHAAEVPRTVAEPADRVQIENSLVRVPVAAPAARQPRVAPTGRRARPIVPRRSALARLFFGNGDFKPAPFPRPAGQR